MQYALNAIVLQYYLLWNKLAIYHFYLRKHIRNHVPPYHFLLAHLIDNIKTIKSTKIRSTKQVSHSWPRANLATHYAHPHGIAESTLWLYGLCERDPTSASTYRAPRIHGLLRADADFYRTTATMKWLVWSTSRTENLPTSLTIFFFRLLQMVRSSRAFPSTYRASTRMFRSQVYGKWSCNLRYYMSTFLIGSLQ